MNRYYYKTLDGKGFLSLKQPATIESEKIEVKEDGEEYIIIEEQPNPDYISITEEEFNQATKKYVDAAVKNA